MEKVVTTLKEFEAEAGRFTKSLAPNPLRATLVTLSGELGAGKTAFSKAVAKTLGITEIVTSPTFVLEKIYPVTEAQFARLIHIDAYRLESGKDLMPLDFDTLMKDPENLILLEWPEKVAEALSEPAVRISLVARPNGFRSIAYA